MSRPVDPSNHDDAVDGATDGTAGPARPVLDVRDLHVHYGAPADAGPPCAASR